MFKLIVETLRKLKILGTSPSGWDGDEMLRRIINTVLLGLFSIITFALSYHRKGAIHIATAGLLTAGAAFLIGSFIGFLFGIPRTLQNNTDLQSNEENANRYSSAYRPNTNLEQISDWLTKILVGVGLTQISQIREEFVNTVRFLKPDLGNNSTVVATIIIYFLLCGLMLGYLWSRLYMAKALVSADINAVSEKVIYEVEIKANMQAKADAKALSMVNAQLNPTPGTYPISKEELTKAINNASPVMKVTVFNQAHLFRQQNWKDKKKKVDLVIPIFQALIESDSDKQFHRNYGQLGYALKDQQNPDWQAAEKALSKAIEIRNKYVGADKWLFYEFNRAYCRIMINKFSPEFSIEDILKDLRSTIKSDGIKKIIASEKYIQQWLNENNITNQSLLE